MQEGDKGRKSSNGKERISITSRILLLIHAALTVLIAVMMFISYPLGAYLVFHTSMGSGYREPIDEFYMFMPLPVHVQVKISVGDLFILLWCTYLLLFTILLLSPKSILSSIVRLVSNSTTVRGNDLTITIAWFSIFVASSTAIDLVQSMFGIEMGSLEYDDRLRYFVDATITPFREELGFRLILIGIPAYLFLAKQGSTLLSVLWRPYEYVRHDKSIYMLIVGSAVLFGFAHIIFSTGWGYGKVTQATLGGLILGWLYYRYGLHTAIIAHWAANYLPLTYLFASDILGSDAILNVLELLLVSNGIVAIALILESYLKGKYITNGKLI
ncbi:MAG: CPBP family intramembrane glutamic endopeptidase [Candidatus Nitrosocaldus sp.]